ncbi:DNA-directed DNA polymerase gamma mip1 [Geranomyces michiganensis]|nr:DNA-directed DNA polymerase gamma mip1 [Geranomyces michiganensis]
MISKKLHQQLFPAICAGPRPKQEELAKEHLDKWGLLGKALDPLPDTETDLPKLTASNILDHFKVLGREQSQWVLEKSQELATSDLPPMPTSWKIGKEAEGWMRYDTRGSGKCKPERVDAPAGDALVFDTEVLYKISPYPVMAIAATKNYWYCWIAPGLFSHSEKHPFEPSALIPLGEPDRKRVIIGHHVAYDRARILEEYRLRPTQFDFVDTMSMHCATGGLSSQQRPAWHEHHKTRAEEKDKYQMSDNPSDLEDSIDWEDVSSPNSLKTVAALYLGKDIDKAAREAFATTDVADILENFEELLTYCATDVEITHRLFRALLPKFLQKCPHPASFAGMLHMGKGYLPISRDWDKYCELAEKKYDEYQDDISAKLLAIAKDALEDGAAERWKDDPWLRNLDWEVKAVRMTKPKIKNGVVIQEARPHRGQKAGGGKPKWFADLIETGETEPRITLSKRVAPYLLKLKWNGFPVFWTKTYGWTYGVPKKDASGAQISGTPCRFSSSKEKESESDPYDPLARPDTTSYYRVPHPRGEGYNCGSPLSKSYISAFEDNTLSSHYDKAKNILAQNAECAYWKSAKQRVHDQFKYWKAHELDDNARAANGSEYGVILPQSIVMGTVTRRAVERTWMTAANAKKNRIGSELKSQVQAPAGYKIVGADVDSEELWIASLLGDAQFLIHGATAIGFMTLQGTKKQGTDLHTVTGKILGISRDSAKMFNYGRIYGAGVKYAVQLLLQHSPGMAKIDAEKKAAELYAKTKGKKFKAKIDGKNTTIWHGGSETFMFNQLEQIAVSDVPTTPVLRCVIPDSLMPKYVKNKFMPSRVNWAVQSSGVDYLHLLLVSMNYLMRRLKIDGRFMVSIHDEVRYLVKEDQSVLAAYCLQIANLWVRTAFSASVGIHDVPASVAFFSSVDIDHCLRKEVDMNCLTPSNQTPLLPGRSVDIYDTEKEIVEWKQARNLSSLWSSELPSIQALRPAEAVKPPPQKVKFGTSSEVDMINHKLAEQTDGRANLLLRMQMSSEESYLRSAQQQLYKLEKSTRDLYQKSKSPSRKEAEIKPRASSAEPSVKAASDNEKTPNKKANIKKGPPKRKSAEKVKSTLNAASPPSAPAKQKVIVNATEVPWSPASRPVEDKKKASFEMVPKVPHPPIMRDVQAKNHQATNVANIV